MANGLGLCRFADARDEEDLAETTDSDTAMDLRFLAPWEAKKWSKITHRFSILKWDGLPPIVYSSLVMFTP